MAGTSALLAGVRKRLRSPRWATGLLVFVVAWTALGTLFPQRGATPAGIQEWTSEHPVLSRVAETLGLYEAFTHPILIGALALLAASTAVCAWERTMRAVRERQERDSVPESVAQALKSQEPVGIEGPHDADGAATLAAERLRSLGLRVTAGPRLVKGSGGSIGLIGSAVFHWSVLALLIVIPLGSLMRAEGIIGIVAGTSRPDTVESYGVYRPGPLATGPSGLEIAVEEGMPIQYEHRGVERGASPVVTISDGEREMARGRVFPNSPLAHGSVAIHMVEFGVGAKYRLVNPDVDASLEDQVFLDVVEEADGIGFTPRPVVLTDGDGAAVASFTVDVPAPDEGAGREGRFLAIEFQDTDGEAVRTVVGEGDVVDLDGEWAVEFVVVDYYARLSVVNDWSTRWIYGLLSLASLAVAVALLAPPRAAYVAVGTGDAGPVYRVVTRAGRGSPGFDARVRAVMAGRDPEEDTEGIDG